MKDGRRLLGELGALRKDDVYFRAHNLLSSGDGTPALKWGSSNAYTEDAAGNAVYDWRIIDGIFDAYLANGVRPFVQLGFMPQALSSAPPSVPYKHSWRPGFNYNLISGGWAYPPRDYERWSELCYQLTRHLVQRYGEAEVLRLVVRDLERAEWPRVLEGERRRVLQAARLRGRRRAPRAAARARRRAAHRRPRRRLHGRFSRSHHHREELRHRRAGHAHRFPRVSRQGCSRSSSTVMSAWASGRTWRPSTPGFRMIAARPQLAGKPIIIGESDPEGCAACQGPRFGYRNGTMYSSYTAASFARKHELRRAPQGEPAGRADLGFRIRGPAVLRRLPPARQQWHRHAGAQRVSHVQPHAGPAGARGELAARCRSTKFSRRASAATPDVGVMASRGGRRARGARLALPRRRRAGPRCARSSSTITGLPRGTATLTHYRIDRLHSNSYAAWQRMGSPIAPDKSAYEGLRAAGQLATLGEPRNCAWRRGRTQLTFPLPRQAVSLLVSRCCADRCIAQDATYSHWHSQV